VLCLIYAADICALLRITQDLKVGNALIHPDPPGRLLLLGLTPCRPEVSLASITGTPSADVATWGVVSSTVAGLVAVVIDHEELVVVHGIGLTCHTRLAMVSRHIITMNAVVSLVADLPAMLHHSAATLHGVLLVEEGLIVFRRQVDELKVLAVVVSHGGGGDLDWDG
jgi:hypothetical protein